MHKIIEKWTEKNVYFFRVFNTLAGIITALFVFGIFKSKPGYFVIANSTMKVFLAFWLIYRFRNANKKPLNEFDRHVCFASGAYIVMSTLAEAFQHIKLMDQIKNISFFNNGVHEVP
jgi:hypothetical protein